MKLLLDPETKSLYTKEAMINDFKTEYEEMNGANTLAALNKNEFKAMFKGWLTGLIEGELIIVIDSESALYAFENDEIPVNESL